MPDPLPAWGILQWAQQKVDLPDELGMLTACDSCTSGKASR